MNTKKILFSTLIAVAFVLVLSTIVIAAESLSPSAAPNPEVGTMKTLEDIYQRIVAGTEAGTHTLNPSAGPAGTMHTLSDIYTAVPTNDNVCSGTNAGTVVLPAEGDVTDGVLYGPSSTLVGSAPAGSADLVWSSVVYGLCWDADPENMWNTEAAGGPYCNTTDLGGWLTTPLGTPVGAVEYCKYLNTAGTALTDTIGIWSLPTPSQLLAALSDQFILNLPTQTGLQAGPSYWSGSEYSEDSAFYIFFADGASSYYASKSLQDGPGFLCVH